MRRIAWIAVLGILTMWTTGCGGNETAEAPPPAPQAAPQTTPPTPDAAAPGAAPAAATPEGEVAVPPPPNGALPAELIASTDPNQRLQQIQAERADPFGGVTVQARLEPVEDANTRASGNLAPVPNLVGNGGGRGSLAPVPNLVGSPSRPTPPPRPQPNLARAVQVSGVVQIGNVPHALVQAPNEPHSRYVRVGDRLSNGAVLVRGIDMRGEPVVILEEVGVQVPLTVGSGVTPSSEGDSGTTTTAALPEIPVNR